MARLPPPKFNNNASNIKPQQQLPIDTPIQIDSTVIPQANKDISHLNDKVTNILKICKTNTKLTPVVQKPQEYDPCRPNDYEEFKKQDQPPPIQIMEEEEVQDQSNLPDIMGSGEEKALKMMEKFGYKFGTGLGKYNQGIVTPLIFKKTATMHGIIEQSQYDFTDLLPANLVYRRAFEQHKQQPTPILVLLNMITAKDLDEHLETEIKGELSKFGEIIKCYIHINPELEEDMQVRVFVEFKDTEQAMSAFFAVDQRVFGQRIIVCRFYLQNLFNDGVFDEPL